MNSFFFFLLKTEMKFFRGSIMGKISILKKQASINTLCTLLSMNVWAFKTRCGNHQWLQIWNKAPFILGGHYSFSLPQAKLPHLITQVSARIFCFWCEPPREIRGREWNVTDSWLTRNDWDCDHFSMFVLLKLQNLLIEKVYMIECRWLERALRGKLKTYKLT